MEAEPCSARRAAVVGLQEERRAWIDRSQDHALDTHNPDSKE